MSQCQGWGWSPRYLVFAWRRISAEFWGYEWNRCCSFPTAKMYYGGSEVAAVIFERLLETVLEKCKYQLNRVNGSLCMRGATLTELENCCLWWNGPVWLLEDQANWPKMDVGPRPSQLQETKAVKQVTTRKQTQLICRTKARVYSDWRVEAWSKRFSSWTRLISLHAR